jgi:hypothetical protein
MSAMSWVRVVLGVLALATLVASEVLGWSLSGLVSGALGVLAGWVIKDPETMAKAKVELPA